VAVVRGPISSGGKGHPPNTPGGVPPARPRTPTQFFANRIVTCDAACPDGSLFTEFVAAGTIFELSQELADAKAHALACNRAQANLFCISADLPPSVCVGAEYFFRINTSGGTDLLWSIDSGSLPPGLNLDPLEGTITGTAITSGFFTFTVFVTDGLGRGQSKLYGMCVVEIVTGATLPEATEGAAYSQALIQEPASVTSETWTLVSGTLPDGITLDAAGTLTGTPTAQGSYEFTLQVAAECNGGAVSCQKAFTMEVASGVDCFGLPESITAATWEVPFPFFGPVVFATGGDGTFDLTTFGAQSPIIQCETDFCNPGDAYAVTVDIEWTAGSSAPVGFFQSTMQININGVFTFSPVHAGEGTFSLHADGTINPGVNHIEIFGGVSFGTPPKDLDGTITVRPLTPP